MLLSKTRWLHRFAFLTTLLALSVVVFGAYTRLMDAGLGCPDWPGCYGHWKVPSHLSTIDDPNAFKKAHIEMTHRYLAGSLGICIVVLTGWMWNMPQYRKHRLLAVALIGLTALQACLGMWTVTWKLFPIVVTTHLLGGMTILGILWYLTLSFYPKKPLLPNPIAISPFLVNTTLFLLFIQLFLGGWTSANYATLACPDFPTCLGEWVPHFHWRKAFDLLNPGIFQNATLAWDRVALTTIHWTHRTFFLPLAACIIWISLQLLKNVSTFSRRTGIFLLALLMTQMTLGITIVLENSPLVMATLHNAIAALLLLSLITVHHILHKRSVMI